MSNTNDYIIQLDRSSDYLYDFSVLDGIESYLILKNYNLFCHIYTTPYQEIFDAELLPNPYIELLSDISARVTFKGKDYKYIPTDRLYFKVIGIEKSSGLSETLTKGTIYIL